MLVSPQPCMHHPKFKRRIGRRSKGKPLHNDLAVPCLDKMAQNDTLHLLNQQAMHPRLHLANQWQLTALHSGASFLLILAPTYRAEISTHDSISKCSLSRQKIDQLLCPAMRI